MTATQAPTPGPLSGDDELIERGLRSIRTYDAVRSLRDALTATTARLTGYDWNADPDAITKQQGDAFAAADRVFADLDAAVASHPDIDLPECEVCNGTGKIEEAARTEGANQHSACIRACDECDGCGFAPDESLAPTASVEASGSEREHGPKCWGKTSISDEMMYCYCGSTDSPPGETREYPWSFYDALKVAGIEHAAFCVNGVTVFGDRSAAKEAERWHHESVSVETYWRPEVIRQRDLLSALALGGQKGDSETLRVLLDNLVIAQTLSKDIRQKATDEARSYLYDLRHTPQQSGETREAVARLTSLADDAEAMSLDIAVSNYVGSGGALVSDLRALIHPAPVASGGQHSSGEGEKNLGWFIGFARKHGHHAQADWLANYAAAPVAETAGEAEQTALNIICDPGIITGLHTAAEARDWIEKSVRAALLSKKKPTSEEVDARRRLINLIEQWDGETEYDAEDIASLADDILHAFNGSPVLSSPALGYVSADAETALKAGVNRVIYPAPSAHASFPLYAAPVPAQDDDKLRDAIALAEYVCGLLPSLAGAADQPDNKVYAAYANKREIMGARDRLAALKAEGK